METNVDMNQVRVTLNEFIRQSEVRYYGSGELKEKEERHEYEYIT